MMLTFNKLKEIVESSKQPTINGNRYAFREPSQYPRTVEGLDRYLKDCGIVYFSGKEVATPHHPEIAKAQGWPGGYLIPPHACWPHGLACLTIADQVRHHVGKPVKCANWWRPDPYNEKVATSGANSDHPHATAIDIEFLGSSAEAAEAHGKASAFLKSLYRRTDYLALGIYPGGRRIHIGVCTAAGRRTW